MAVYCVSFNLEYDQSYSERYDSFMDEVKKSGLWWAETTSFVVVESNETLDDFSSRIYLHSLFDASKDRCLVLDANKLGGTYRGPLADGDLTTLLPFVKKL